MIVRLETCLSNPDALRLRRRHRPQVGVGAPGSGRAHRLHDVLVAVLAAAVQFQSRNDGIVPGYYVADGRCFLD